MQNIPYNENIEKPKIKWLIVVWHPVSDIWKWWVTSSIASLLDNPTVIKIDPMLENNFPEWLWEKINWKIVTDDVLSYQSQWIKFKPEQNIMMWDMINKSLSEPASKNWIINNEVSKKTWTDVASYFANHILELIKNNNSNNFIIEVWWCPDDKEADLIPLAIRHFISKTNAEVWIIIVTKYDTAMWKNWIEFKTRWPVRAIEETMIKYWNMKLEWCFIRRDTVPETISDDILKEWTKKVAHKTWLNENEIHYLPNVDQITELKPYTKNIINK